jgi:glycosyltransferase involved in cell wall biosynthesis
MLPVNSNSRFRMMLRDVYDGLADVARRILMTQTRSATRGGSFSRSRRGDTRRCEAMHGSCESVVRNRGDSALDVDVTQGEASGPVRFSVVIPCYNEGEYVAAAINSLRAQSFPGGCEIVVVDNNCTDDTAQIARSLGARVVVESRQGVCHARRRGTEVSRGDVVISADADTTYPADWLTYIDRSFRTAGERVVAVAGPCRYQDGPRWGRVYGRLLFGFLHLIYRLSGRLYYVTATNLAFRRDCWPGYNVELTQGGDELDLLRKLRRLGAVRYDHANPVLTSSRRLARGLLYNLVVTLFVYYLSAYLLNRAFRRRIIGSAPPCRRVSAHPHRRLRGWGTSVLVLVLGVMPSATIRHAVTDVSHSVIERVSLLVDPDEDG